MAVWSIVLSAVATAAGAGAIEPMATTRVASGLNLPVYVTHAPGDYGRLFIVEKPGRIKILDLVTGQINIEPFLDIDALVAQGQTPFSDPGLFSLAFHPNYAVNGYMYVHYITDDQAVAGHESLKNTIARFQVSADPDIADVDSGQVLLKIGPVVGGVHFGGWIGFGADGYLYIPLGDGGPQEDPENRAQNLSELRGKVLRIDVNQDDFPNDDLKNYGVPSDNPFVGAAGADEIWAYGLRNPWRCSFDRGTGDFYIADVGQYLWEEIDFQPQSSAGGENYGWRCYEANHAFNPVDCPPMETLVFPIHEYGHNSAGGFAVIGGYVYRGCHIPSLRGAYVFADFLTNHIWSLRHDGQSATELVLHDAEFSISLEGAVVNDIVSFGEDLLGELYVVDQGAGSDGQVFRIVPQLDSIPLGDLNCDTSVGIVDFLLLLSLWGPCSGCPADLDGDGLVGVTDFLILLMNWTL